MSANQAPPRPVVHLELHTSDQVRAIAFYAQLLHSRAQVAVCIENISGPTAPTVTWDLHAGDINGGPLKKVATINPVHPTTEASQWGVAFTQMGDYLIFSTPTTPTGQETLFIIKTAEIGTGTPTMVGAPGVSRWS